MSETTYKSDNKEATCPAVERDATVACQTRVIVVDDFPVVRDGLAQIIDQHPSMCCVAKAGNADEALMMLRHINADLAVVDISLGSSNGLDLIRALHGLYPTMRALALSMHNESLYAEYALCNGARGYVMKEEVTDSIFQAMSCVVQGGIYLSDRMTNRILDRIYRPLPHGGMILETLSRQQATIFEMLGRNHALITIAGELDISHEILMNELDLLRSILNCETMAYLEALAVIILQSGRSRPLS